MATQRNSVALALLDLLGAAAAAASISPAGPVRPVPEAACCVPDGAWRCVGPCFVNETVVEFTERDVLTSFGGGAFLNNTIHNSKTSFTEFEVYTQLPNDCHVYTGATMQRSDSPESKQVVLEDLYFRDDCNSFTKVVKGQQQPGPLVCKVDCTREQPDGHDGTAVGRERQAVKSDDSSAGTAAAAARYTEAEAAPGAPFGPLYGPVPATAVTFTVTTQGIRC
jgi:hypothetical protein